MTNHNSMHTLKHIVGYSFPLLLLAAFIIFPGHFVLDSETMLREFALTSVALFGVIFIIGPLPKFWEDLAPWKVFRPYWAKWAVFFALVHIFLVLATIYSWNWSLIFSVNEPLALAKYLGLLAVLYFIFMIVLSIPPIREKIGPWWKRFHVAGYVAFTLALLHILLMNTEDSQLKLATVTERLIFSFGVVVLVTRLYVLVWTHLTKPKK